MTGPTSAGMVTVFSALTSSVFGIAAEKDEPADRHHHRAADALEATAPRRFPRASG